MNKLEDLPISIRCHECPQDHYLAVNRAFDGTWSGAYVEFLKGTALCSINGAVDLQECATRLRYSLQRYNRRIENENRQTN